jgi:hypothetical protein
MPCTSSLLLRRLAESSRARKEKNVSQFGMNMTPDDESSDGGSVIKMKLELATDVECFHARKFGAKTMRKEER